MKSIKAILVMAVLCPGLTFAQNQKNSTVQIAGESMMKVKPDLVGISISFNSIDMAFNRAVRDVNEKTERLLKQLEKIGFKSDEISSNSFNAGKNTFWRNGMSVDSGYIATQSITLEFSYNKDRITKLVDSFAESTIALEFYFNFTLSEAKTKETKNKLIELCVADAKAKAELIARNSKVKLGTIQSIGYGNGNNNYDSPRHLSMAALKAPPNMSSGFSGLNVEDIEVSDEVTITWNVVN